MDKQTQSLCRWKICLCPVKLILRPMSTTSSSHTIGPDTEGLDPIDYEVNKLQDTFVIVGLDPIDYEVNKLLDTIGPDT